MAQLSGPLSGSLGPDTYSVIADISVTAGDSLTIQPGTTFLFEGQFSFEIYGYLHAFGTEADSIRFEPSAGIPALDRITFEQGSDNSNIMEYCVIRKCDTRGIYIHMCNPTISKCFITECLPYYYPPAAGGGIYVDQAIRSLSTV